MRLFQEIFKSGQSIGQDILPLPRCVFFVGAGGYFESVRSVGDFSSERIVLHFKKGGVEIEGEALVIRKFYDGDLELTGKIKSVRFFQAEKDGGLK